MKELEGFDDLINLGAVSKDITLAGHKIRLHTLNSYEYSKVTERIPDDMPTSSSRLEAMQREVLCAAIDSIDDKKLSAEAKRLLLSTGQLGLANLLYQQYAEMIDEQQVLLDDAKKNGSQTKSSQETSQKAPDSKLD